MASIHSLFENSGFLAARIKKISGKAKPMPITLLDDDAFGRELARQLVKDSEGAFLPGYEARGHAAVLRLSEPALREYVSLRAEHDTLQKAHEERPKGIDLIPGVGLFTYYWRRSRDPGFGTSIIDHVKAEPIWHIYQAPPATAMLYGAGEAVGAIQRIF